MDVFPRVVWIMSQLTAFVLKLQQKNLHGQKSIVWKTALLPQYLLTRMWSFIFSCDFFLLFSANLMVIDGKPISVFTNIMNNSAKLKDRELRMIVLIVLVILEIHSLLALECATCVCLIRKL